MDDNHKVKRKPATKAAPPMRAVRETLVIDAATFSMVVQVLNTLSTSINIELPELVRNVTELKTMAWQLAENHQLLSNDMQKLTTDVERIAQRVGAVPGQRQPYDPDPHNYRQQPPMRLATPEVPQPPSTESLRQVLNRVQGIGGEPTRPVDILSGAGGGGGASEAERLVPRR